MEDLNIDRLSPGIVVIQSRAMRCGSFEWPCRRGADDVRRRLGLGRPCDCNRAMPILYGINKGQCRCRSDKVQTFTWSSLLHSLPLVENCQDHQSHCPASFAAIVLFQITPNRRS